MIGATEHDEAEEGKGKGKGSIESVYTTEYGYVGRLPDHDACMRDMPRAPAYVADDFSLWP